MMWSQWAWVTRTTSPRGTFSATRAPSEATRPAHKRRAGGRETNGSISSVRPPTDSSMPATPSQRMPTDVFIARVSRRTRFRARGDCRQTCRQYILPTPAWDDRERGGQGRRTVAADGGVRPLYNGSVRHEERPLVKAARHSVPEGNAMIIRVFGARLKAGMRSAYERLCCEVSLPTIRAQQGCLATQIGTPRAGQPEDFVVVPLWSDVESLRAFAGEQWQQAIIVPGEADLLEQVRVEHYDETYRSLVQLWRAQAGVVKRREVTAMAAPLSDAQWQAVQRVLPAQQGRGRPRGRARGPPRRGLYLLRHRPPRPGIPTADRGPVTCARRVVRPACGRT